MPKACWPSSCRPPSRRPGFPRSPPVLADLLGDRLLSRRHHAFRGTDAAAAWRLGSGRSRAAETGAGLVATNDVHYHPSPAAALQDNGSPPSAWLHGGRAGRRRFASAERPRQGAGRDGAPLRRHPRSPSNARGRWPLRARPSAALPVSGMTKAATTPQAGWGPRLRLPGIWRYPRQGVARSVATEFQLI